MVSIGRAEELNIVIKGKDQLSGTLDKTGKSMSTFKKLAIGAFAAIASYGTYRLAEMGAQFSQVERAFREMAHNMGANANVLLKDLERMSAGTVSQLDLMQAANRAMIFNIPIDKISELMEISRAAATALGQDVSFMFDSIVTGIGRASPKIIDNLGIIMKAEDAYEAMAARMGKTAQELTATEKSMAILNEVLDKGGDLIDRVGTAGRELTDAEVFQQLKAQMANVSAELGRALLPFMKMLIDMAMPLVQIIKSLAQRFQELPESIQKLILGATGLAALAVILNHVAGAAGVLAAKILLIAGAGVAAGIGIATLVLAINRWRQNEDISFVDALKDSFNFCTGAIKDFTGAIYEAIVPSEEFTDSALAAGEGAETYAAMLELARQEAEAFRKEQEALQKQLEQQERQEEIMGVTGEKLIETLLNQDKVTKAKGETVEEFAKRLRDVDIAEKYVKEAMEKGSIQLDTQDRLVGALGEQYANYINELRIAQGYEAIEISQLAELLGVFDETTGKITETTNAINTYEAAMEGLNTIAETHGFIIQDLVSYYQGLDAAMKQQMGTLAITREGGQPGDVFITNPATLTEQFHGVQASNVGGWQEIQNTFRGMSNDIRNVNNELRTTGQLMRNLNERSARQRAEFLNEEVSTWGY